MVYHGWCDKHNKRKSMGRNGGPYCHSCLVEEKKEIADRKALVETKLRTK